MPEPTVNTAIFCGRVIGQPQRDYIGSSKMARARFTLGQRRVFMKDCGVRGSEDVVMDCEIWGRQAERFTSMIGHSSVVHVEGKLRSYRHGDGTRVYLVTFNWVVLYEVPPGVGYQRRRWKASEATLGPDWKYELPNEPVADRRKRRKPLSRDDISPRHRGSRERRPEDDERKDE